MRNVLRSAVLAASAVGLGLGIAEAAKGPKTPDIPFMIHVFTRSTNQGTVDSTNDVRKAIEDKEGDWFRLTENRAEADIVLEITSRDGSRDNLIVRGRLTTANLDNHGIIGQCIPGILDLKGPWKSAAANMAKRIEHFCRDTYSELVEAQRTRTKVGRSASQ
jgi:hypothetical protein